MGIVFGTYQLVWLSPWPIYQHSHFCDIVSFHCIVSQPDDKGQNIARSNKDNLHPNIFKIYDPLCQKHPDSRTCSVAKEREWWHILWQYGNTLDLCQEITEGTVSIVVAGLVFAGLANTCWLNTQWCWEIVSKFRSITACNGQPSVCRRCSRRKLFVFTWNHNAAATCAAAAEKSKGLASMGQIHALFFFMFCW